jgi:hypothetical protein
LTLQTGPAYKDGPVVKANLQQPSKVKRASARLDAAVARLEAALESRTLSTSGEGLDPELSRELKTLRGQNAQLRTVNETVSGRLDGAIGRLKDVLGEA